jgi:ketosteroid isomerase-like protein
MGVPMPGFKRCARQPRPNNLGNGFQAYNAGDSMSKITEAQIMAAEERLRLAMLHSDVQVLDELIAPELIFTNHLGQVLQKQDDLAAHQSGALKLTGLSPTEQHLQIYASFAIVSVLMHLAGRFEGAPIDFRIRYTRIWSLTPDGSLQIIAGHASALVES